MDGVSFLKLGGEFSGLEEVYSVYWLGIGDRTGRGEVMIVWC